MPSVSEVSICNQAIGWVGGNRITSFTDGSIEANLCIDNYEGIKKAVLEASDWTFATNRLIPSPEVSPPEFGYSYSFLMPANCIRVLSVSDNPDWNKEGNIEWQYEDRKILCDYQIIYVKYIKNVDDTSKFSPLFVQALAARISADFAIPLAQSRTLQADQWRLYERKINEANNKDGLQGKHKNKKIKSSWLSGARLK